ncbi:MAG: hypothetical protein GX902_11860 [Lentisphaerae bacterium]|nr:hypothetical protein [Lentisphaerota bacterium]
MARSKKLNVKRRVQFVYYGKAGQEVFLSGEFNAWATDKKPMLDKQGNGQFVATCVLAAGEYQYKFFVDGLWVLDSRNPNFVVNEFGSHNSVLKVQ